MKLAVDVSSQCSVRTDVSAVLGPMVYACAFCPTSFKPTLEGLGFDGMF